MIRVYIFAIAAQFLFLVCAPSAAQMQVRHPSEIPEPGIGDAAAYYDAATGDIYLALGEQLVAVVLYDAPFGFRSGILDTSLVDETTGLGPPVTNDGQEIGWLVLDTSLPKGTFNVGPLLPADSFISTNADFDLIYPDAKFEFGARGVLSTISRINVIRPAFVIPEPSAFSLLLVAGIVAAARRSRR